MYLFLSLFSCSTFHLLSAPSLPLLAPPFPSSSPSVPSRLHTFLHTHNHHHHFHTYRALKLRVHSWMHPRRCVAAASVRPLQMCDRVRPESEKAHPRPNHLRKPILLQKSSDASRRKVAGHPASAHPEGEAVPDPCANAWWKAQWARQ